MNVKNRAREAEQDQQYMNGQPPLTQCLPAPAIDRCAQAGDQGEQKDYRKNENRKTFMLVAPIGQKKRTGNQEPDQRRHLVQSDDRETSHRHGLLDDRNKVENSAKSNRSQRQLEHALPASDHRHERMP